MSDVLFLVQSLIHDIRGIKVMLDYDLAKLYQIETKALKQAVRRNRERFPDDFMFELSQDEYNSLHRRPPIGSLFYCLLTFFAYFVAMRPSALGWFSMYRCPMAFFRFFRQSVFNYL